MNPIDTNLETYDDDIVADEMDISRIEETLGRVMQDGKNKPFAHTCENPSQICSCWIQVDNRDEDGNGRIERVWFSVRPNRKARRLAAAKRKEPLKNDGTTKRRFD